MMLEYLGWQEAAALITKGRNVNYLDGHAIFEATHGTAPKYANPDVVNPGSVIRSGVMMLEYLGWQEAADLVTKGFFFSSRRRHTRCLSDWSSDVCSSD